MVPVVFEIINQLWPTFDLYVAAKLLQIPLSYLNTVFFLDKFDISAHFYFVVLRASYGVRGISRGSHVKNYFKLPRHSS